MSLLAWVRFAFRPVGCAVSRAASAFVPKRTEGAGPVCCGMSGAAGAGAGADIGAGGPDRPGMPVLCGSSAGGRYEFTPPPVGAE